MQEKRAVNMDIHFLKRILILIIEYQMEKEENVEDVKSVGRE